MQISELPTDVSTLQAMVLDLHEAKNRLFEQVRLLQLRHFGRSSEITHQDQLALFTPADVIVVDTILDEDKNQTDSSPKQNKQDPKVVKRESYAFDNSIETETRVIDIEDADKSCDCCGHSLHECGRDPSRRVEYEPARLKLIIIERPKYGCRGC